MYNGGPDVDKSTKNRRKFDPKKRLEKKREKNDNHEAAASLPEALIRRIRLTQQHPARFFLFFLFFWFFLVFFVFFCFFVFFRVF